MNVKVKHYKTVDRTPALPLLLSAWNELSVRGLCENDIMIQWDHQALVAFDSCGFPVGVISYIHTEHNHLFHIVLGYVVSIHRGQKVYSQLWKRLVEIAQENKVVCISSQTHKRNDVMLKVAEAQNRRSMGVIVNYDVPPSEQS